MLSEAMPSQHYFGGMAANQTTFDGQQFRNQVAYAFKNRSTYTPPFQQMSPQMPTQFQQQMGMGSGYMYPPQMYGGMAQMGMMNMDASNFYTDEKKAKKIKAKKKPTVDIDLSNESNSNSSSDEE